MTRRLYARTPEQAGKHHNEYLHSGRKPAECRIPHFGCRCGGGNDALCARADSDPKRRFHDLASQLRTADAHAAAGIILPQIKSPSLRIPPYSGFQKDGLVGESPLRPQTRRKGGLSPLEQFQFEMLRIPNHTACRFAEKARFFRSLWAGRRCAAASRFTFFKVETL